MTPKGLKEALEELPAIFINKVSISLGEVVKITFIEQNGNEGELHPRSCVVMTKENARAFSDLLLKLLGEKSSLIHLPDKGPNNLRKN